MITVSCIQFAPDMASSASDVRKNMSKAEKLIEDAIELGSKFIVLPELCFTGYTFLSQVDAALVSETSDGQTYDFIASFAVKGNCYISYGYVESDEDGVLYNSVNLVSPDGIIVSTFRKINLWGNDFLWARAGGESSKVIETPLGKTAVIICRDLRDKTPSYSDVKDIMGEVDFVMASVNWGRGGFPANTWVDFCQKNKCTLAVANRYGLEQNEGMENDFGTGGSVIITPSMDFFVDGLAFNSDCVVSADVQPVVKVK